jgi:ABC-type Fe3+ transport system substrate-binding protein
MLAYWDSQIMRGYYDAFLEGLAENHARLLPSGNAGVVDAVAKGEADVGMTDTDDVWAAQAAGLKVQMVYPLHNVVPGEKGAGTLLIPNTAAIVQGGPHPDLAALLVVFLLSEKVERMLAESDSHNIPLRPSLANAYPQLAVPNPLAIDLKDAAAKRTPAVEKAVRALSDLTPPVSSAPASTTPASSAAASKPGEAASSEPR